MFFNKKHDVLQILGDISEWGKSTPEKVLLHQKQENKLGLSLAKLKLS